MFRYCAARSEKQLGQGPQLSSLSFSFSSLPFSPHGDTHFSRDTPPGQILRPPTTIFTGRAVSLLLGGLPLHWKSNSMLCVSFSKKPSSWPLPPLLSLVPVPFFLLQCLVCLPVCLTCRKKSAASKAIHRILGRRRLSPSPSSFPSSSSSSSLVSLLLVYCCSRSPNQTLCPRRSRYGVSVAAPACPGPRCVRCSALLCATVPNLPLPSSISSGFRTARPAAAPSLAQQLHSVIRPSPCFSATLSTPTPRSKIPLSADTAAHTPWSIIFPYPRPRVPPIVPKTKAQTRQG